MARKAKYLEGTHQACLMRFLDRLEKMGYPLTAEGDQNAAKRGARAAAEAKMTGLKPGAPDVRVLMDDRDILFAELKTEVGVLSEDQENRHARYAALGHEVIIIATDHPHKTCLVMAKALSERMRLDWVEVQSVARECCDEVMTAMGLR